MPDNQDKTNKSTTISPGKDEDNTQTSPGGKGSNRSVGKSPAAAYLILAVIFLGIAWYIRFPAPQFQHAQAFFSRAMTSPFSANALFHGYPDQWKIFVPLVRDILGRFLWAYTIPTLLYLGGMVFALAGFRKFEEKNKALDKSQFDPDFSSSPAFSLTPAIKWMEQKKILLILLLVFLVGIVIFRYMLLDKVIFSGDEFSYLWQAEIMSRFKAFIPAPQPDSSFTCNEIVNNGKFFSKYTVGFPILLVPFAYLKNPFLLNPLMAMLCLGAIYFLGKELFDRGTGIMAAILLAISPFFLLNSIILLVHTPFLFFYLVFILFYLKTIKEKSIINPIISGAAFGFAAMIRPADTAFPGFLFFLFSLFFLYLGGWNPENEDRGANRRRILGYFLVMLVTACLFLGFLFYINKLQTGNPYKFAFQEYIEDEKWGMGVWGHNHIRAAWNTIFSLTRLFVWMPPLVVGLSLLSLFERKRQNLFLFFLAVSPAVFYYMYYGIGFHEFGPRYYFSMLAVLPVMAARGMIWLEYALKRKGKWIPAAAVILIITVCFTLFGTLPGIARQAAIYPWELTTFFRMVEERFSREPGGVVLFLQTTPKQLTAYYTRNDPFLKNPVTFANFLGPDLNRQVVEKFPGKKPWTVNFDDATQQWSFTPYDNRPFETLPLMEKVRIRILAALNYSVALRDYKKAEEEIQKGLREAPDSPNLLDMMGIVKKAMDDYQGAEKYWSRVIQVAPDYNPDVYYNLALAQDFLGKKKEAYGNLKIFLSKNPQGISARKARFWMEHYELSK